MARDGAEHRCLVLTALGKLGRTPAGRKWMEETRSASSGRRPPA